MLKGHFLKLLPRWLSPHTQGPVHSLDETRERIHTFPSWMKTDGLQSMSRHLIWMVGDQWISQDTGQRHNRVWHWHMHLSRSLSGCWTAARNSAALRGFLLAALSLHAWLYRAGWTLGPFFLSLIWLSALVHCLIAHRPLPFTALCAICWKASGLVVTSHKGAQQWLWDLDSSGFKITSQLPFQWFNSS